MIKKIPTQRPSFSRIAAITIAAFILACCAALLTGCGPNPESNHRLIALTDDDGCKYVGVIGDKNAPAFVNPRLDPVLGRDGKQVCKPVSALMVGAK